MAGRVYEVQPGLLMAVYGAPSAKAADKRARASFPNAKRLRHVSAGVQPTIGAVWEPSCPTFACSGPTRPFPCDACLKARVVA